VRPRDPNPARELDNGRQDEHDREEQREEQ
jgi:hypothetical protein